MSIEIGSKWVKDVEVVEVYNITETVGRDEVIYYKCKQGKSHILYDYDFLEQYKPYEPVYEYKWAYLNKKDFFIAIDDKHFYLDEEEFYKAYRKEHIVGQRLDFTKRERKQ